MDSVKLHERVDFRINKMVLTSNFMESVVEPAQVDVERHVEKDHINLSVVDKEGRSYNNN